nr:hypothetical protein [Streptomyces alfalfae]
MLLDDGYLGLRRDHPGQAVTPPRKPNKIASSGSYGAVSGAAVTEFGGAGRGPAVDAPRLGHMRTPYRMIRKKGSILMEGEEVTGMAETNGDRDLPACPQ